MINPIAMAIFNSNYKKNNVAFRGNSLKPTQEIVGKNVDKRIMDIFKRTETSGIKIPNLELLSKETYKLMDYFGDSDKTCNTYYAYSDMALNAIKECIEKTPESAENLAEFLREKNDGRYLVSETPYRAGDETDKFLIENFYKNPQEDMLNVKEFYGDYQDTVEAIKTYNEVAEPDRTYLMSLFSLKKGAHTKYTPKEALSLLNLEKQYSGAVSSLSRISNDEYDINDIKTLAPLYEINKKLIKSGLQTLFTKNSLVYRTNNYKTEDFINLEKEYIPYAKFMNNLGLRNYDIQKEKIFLALCEMFKSNNLDFIVTGKSLTTFYKLYSNLPQVIKDNFVEYCETSGCENFDDAIKLMKG